MSIKKVIKKVWRLVKNLMRGAFWYVGDLFLYRKLLRQSKTKVAMRIFPQVFDKDPEAHTFDKHYVYMDRWACKAILYARPAEHVDVGSSIRFLSFASLVSKTTFVDIRPVKLDFDNFSFREGSILTMPFVDNSISSLSCLHVAEHIGLGRYGDALDPFGTEKACIELARVLAPGGKLYFALPIGTPATYFNAHRVHDPETIVRYFSGLKLVQFSAISDEGNFVSDARLADYKNSSYACGCFVFTKE